MLASSLRRVARPSAVPLTSGSISSTPTVASSSNGVLATVIRQAQRRYSSSSSSKPPVPPSDGSRRIDASAPAKGVNPSGKASREGKASKRRNGRQSAKSSQDAAFLNLPSVPSTQHMQPHDIHVASFFSIHRPISLNTSVPQPTSNEAFNSLFSSNRQPKNEPEDVIYTLSSAVQTLENAAHHQQYALSEIEDLRHAIAEPEAIHLDGVPAVSIEEFVKRLRPFHPPPPPVPADEAKAAESMRNKANRETSSQSYTTVVTIRESTHADGHKTYEAHASPFVRNEDMEAPGVLDAEHAVIEEPQDSSSGSTYIERLRRNRVMHAISVKRQRKLKMKKHKYKKLMRKTRTLRRRLDKA